VIDTAGDANLNEISPEIYAISPLFVGSDKYQTIIAVQAAFWVLM